MEKFNELISSLSDSFGSKLPVVLGALAVLLIGFFIARIVKRIVKNLLGRTSLDEKIGGRLKTDFRVDDFIAKLAYYLVVIYAILVTLNMVVVDGVLEPLQNMVSEFIGYLPIIMGAGIIGYAGFILAKVVSEATGFVSERLTNYTEKAGVNLGTIDLAKIVKQFIFIIIFIPILIIALDTLNFKAISEPATEMLQKLMNAIPQILAAAILLGVFFVVGRYVTSILSELLKNLGLDDMTEKIGLKQTLGEVSLSKLVGNIAMFFIMFTGIIAAADKLELGQVGEILNRIFEISGQVFFGLIILVAGLFISNVATSTLAKNESNAFLVPVVKFAILGIFLAFALHTMGIASSIVNMAFGLTLGALAVAFALSFGLGGREAAGEQMKKFFDKMK